MDGCLEHSSWMELSAMDRPVERDGSVELEDGHVDQAD